MEEECLQTAWTIVNDSFFTDAILLYPPYLIALAGIYIACIHVEKDPTVWFEKLNVDQQEVHSSCRRSAMLNVCSPQVQDVVQTLFSLYKSFAKTGGTKEEVSRLIQRLDLVVPAIQM
jgi:hypothetical protein